MLKRDGWTGWRNWLLALAFTPAAAACGGTSHQDERELGAAGSGASAGGSASDHPRGAGANAGGAGTASRAGADTAGAGMAGAGGTRGGTGGTRGGAGGTNTGGADGMGGADGAGGTGGTGNELCNELQLVPLAPVCTALASPPAAQGGAILGGTYALIAYQSPICFAGLEQTVHLTSMAADTFEMRTVLNLDQARANAVMVREGTELRSTSTCGGTEANEVYGYSAYEQQGERYLLLMTDTEGAFTYRRVGD